jgi:hypothetical protein
MPCTLCVRVCVCVCVSHNPSQKVPNRRHSTRLNVCASDSRSTRGAGSEDFAALLDVQNFSTANTDGAAAGGDGSPGEFNGAEVGKGHQRTARLKVLNDPLGVGLAQGIGLARESVRYSLAGRDVLDGGRAGSGAGGRDGHFNGVASGNGNPAEVIGIFMIKSAQIHMK